MTGQRLNQYEWFWKRFLFVSWVWLIMNCCVTLGGQINKDVYVAPDVTPGSPNNDVYTTFNFFVGDVLQLSIHKKNQSTPDIAESHITDQDTSDTVLWSKTGHAGALDTYMLAGPNGIGVKQNETFWLKVNGTFATGGVGGGGNGTANASKFDASVIDVVITQPTQDKVDVYPSQPNYNLTGPVPFTAVVRGAEYSGNIDWTQDLSYDAGGNKYSATLQGFSSGNGQTTNRTFQSVGGSLMTWAAASAPVKGVTCSSPPTTSYIAGCIIPNAVITTRLRALYNPPRATAGLLTGIAFAESTYAQFANITKYGITAKWPKESPTTPSGKFIGLMMVPVAMDTAWDWLANTQSGANWYAVKLTRTDSEVVTLRNLHQGLPALTNFQAENYALGLYVGSSSKYYVPVQNGGTWQWQPTTNQKLLTYVTTVRDNIK